MGHYKCMFNLFNICIVTTFVNDLFSVIEILFISVPKFFEYKYSKSSSMISRLHFAKKKDVTIPGEYNPHGFLESDGVGS